MVFVELAFIAAMTASLPTLGFTVAVTVTVTATPIFPTRPPLNSHRIVCDGVVLPRLKPPYCNMIADITGRNLEKSPYNSPVPPLSILSPFLGSLPENFVQAARNVLERFLALASDRDRGAETKKGGESEETDTVIKAEKSLVETVEV